MTKPHRATRWVVVVLLLALVAAAWRWGATVLEFFRNQSALQAWVASFGAWAPLVSIALNTAQVIAAPIPGQVVGLANGYLFGVGWGTFYSLLGVTLGTGLVMTLTRRWGRPFAVRLVPPPQVEKLDRLAARRGTVFFFLVFLLPFVPDDLACFAIGLTTLPLGQMLVLATLGRLPGLIVSSWVGAHAAQLGLIEWIALIGGAGLLGVGFLRWGELIEHKLLERIERLAEKIRGLG